MPVCYCESYGCNGKDVVSRTFESHHREDKRRNFRHAYAKATQVCNQQNDDIATYISSLTLSDDATGSTSGLGGRLWFRSVQDDDDATGSDAAPASLHRSTDTPHSSHHPHASRRHSLINDTLSELANIEKELGYLVSAAEPQLKSLGAPLSPDDPFPLKSLISTACVLHDRLSAVNNQASSVRETKATISNRLSAFLEELMSGNKLWNKKVK